MTLDDLKLFWRFEPTLDVGDEIQCPSCKEWAFHAFWLESSVGCEDCGEHMAIECPHCGDRHDHVFGPTFNTRSPS